MRKGMSSGRQIELPLTYGPQVALEGDDWVRGWVKRERS